MNLYNIPFVFSIPKVLKDLIISENNNNPYLIISPNKKAQEACEHEFKSNPKIIKKVKVVAISDVQELLTELFQVASNNLKTEIIQLQNIKIISPNTRSFLLVKLIKAAKPGISLENALAIGEEIAELLDILTAENIHISELKQFSALSSFAEEILNLITSIDNYWHSILLEAKMYDILSYKTKTFNLISNIIQSTTSKVNIIIFAIDNYANATVDLLKAIAKYNSGKVIFSGIDYFLNKESWKNLPNTHPQYANSQILGKLQIDKNNVISLPEILNKNKQPRQSTNDKQSVNFNNTHKIEFVSRIFDQLAYRISDCAFKVNKGCLPLSDTSEKQLELFKKESITKDIYEDTINNISYLEVANEDIETNLIIELINKQLQQNNNITIVTTNVDLSRRIILKLEEKQISYDSSFGVELSRTSNSSFFKLISTVNLSNINFVDLLALLKHSFCSLGPSKNYVYLIDLLLARTNLPNKNIQGYLELLNQLLNSKKITDSEYYNIKQILFTLEEFYENFYTITQNKNFNFKEALKAHISIAEKFSIKLENQEALIWKGKPGETLKNSLASIIEEIDFLPEVTLEEYNNILQLLLKKYNARNILNNKAQVFICGALQAQFINSNIVILADLNEGSFPLIPKSGIAFISYLLQQLKLPNKYDSIGKEAFIFNKLCCNSKLYLTRSIKKQNKVTTPSRFIVKLLNTLTANKLQLNNKELVDIHNKLVNCSFQDASTAKRDTVIKAIEANPEIKYRPKKISATSVEKLLQNPYLFFIEQVLKLNIIAPLNQDFDAKLQGNLIHETLHSLLNNNDNLNLLSTESLNQKLINIATYKFTPFMQNQSNAILSFNIFKYFVFNLSTALKSLLCQASYIDSEVSGKVIINYEQEENLTITGRSDCIAIIENSGVIIDFKTGNFSPSKGDIEKFKKQLIILGYILKNEGFYSKKNNLNNLEYWVLPNNFSDKFSKIKLKNLLKVDNLDEYVTNDFNYLKDTLYNYLLTQVSFNLSSKHKMAKEYEHFSRKNELITY